MISLMMSYRHRFHLSQLSIFKKHQRDFHNTCIYMLIRLVFFFYLPKAQQNKELSIALLQKALFARENSVVLVEELYSSIQHFLFALSAF